MIERRGQDVPVDGDRPASPARLRQTINPSGIRKKIAIQAKHGSRQQAPRSFRDARAKGLHARLSGGASHKRLSWLSALMLPHVQRFAGPSSGSSRAAWGQDNVTGLPRFKTEPSARAECWLDDARHPVGTLTR